MIMKSVTETSFQVVLRQLQQELADTLKKQCLSEASLEVISRDCTNLEAEIQDLKKTLEQMRNQVCMKRNISTVKLQLTK